MAFAENLDLTDATKTYFDVVHASPDAPAVDVGPVTGGAIAQPALLPNLAFGKDVVTPGLAPATLSLGVAAHTSPATTAPIETFGVTTTAGGRAFVVAAGSLGGVNGHPFELIAIDTSKSPATGPWTATASTHQ